MTGVDDEELRWAMIRLAEPPQTTPAAFESIADRMAERRHRTRRVVLGAIAATVVVIIVMALAWPRISGSSSAVDQTGEVQIVIAGSGVVGVSIEAELRFSSDRLLDSAEYTLDRHAIVPATDIMNGDNLPEYPHPLHAHPGELILILGTTKPDCVTPLGDQITLRVTSLDADGSPTIEVFTVTNPEVYSAGVEKWCLGTINARIGSAWVESGVSAQVTLVLSNPSPKDVLIHTPVLASNTADVHWRANVYETRLRGGAANTVTYWGTGSAIACDMADVPWGDGQITANGAPVEVAGQLCDGQ